MRLTSLRIPSWGFFLLLLAASGCKNNNDVFFQDKKDLRPNSINNSVILKRNSEPIDQCRARIKEKYFDTGLYHSDADPCAIVKIGGNSIIMCVQTVDGALSCFLKYKPAKDDYLNDIKLPQDWGTILDFEVMDRYICAKDSLQSIKCWDYNGVTRPTFNGNIKKLVLSSSYGGGNSGCAITDVGVECWGETLKIVPEEIKTATNVDEICLDENTMTANTICARQGARVRCRNQYLEFGEEFPANDPRSGIVSGVPKDLKNPRDLSSYIGSACANTDQGIRCWGMNWSSIPGGKDHPSDGDILKKAFPSFRNHSSEFCGFNPDGQLVCTGTDESTQNWLKHVNSLPNVRQAVGSGPCVLSDMGIECKPPLLKDSKVDYPKEFVLRPK